MEKEMENGIPNKPNIPKTWKAPNFGDVFEVVSASGKKIKQKDYLKEGTIPVIDQGEKMIGGFTNLMKSKINIEKPVIIFGDHTRCFKYINFDFAPGADGTKILRPQGMLDPKFLYYVCQILQLPDRGYSRHFSFLKKSNIPLAPLNEQKRIVDKIERLFSALDEGEALLKTVQKQLDTYRQSVLKSAVTGELTQDWRKKNKHRLSSGEDLLKRILKSRRENWKYKEPKTPDTSKLPDLPDRWVWANPEQLKSSVSNSLCIGPFGSNLKVSDYKNSGVSLVFVRHIRAKQFNGLKPRFVSKEKAQELSSHRVVGGDLLVTKMGEPPGEVCIYPENNSEAIITADCIRFSPNKALLNTEYLELAIGSQVVQQQIREITKGVAQQKVTLANFRAIAIPLAGLDEQKQIADICSDIFSQINVLGNWCSTELTHSRTLRQSILKDAFSGKLVPQDPADEPASQLLKRIQAERDKQPKPKSRKGKKRVTA